MAFWSWSRTAASNASADSTINYAEGQAPSSLNDSARAAMARLAEYRDDISGAIVTGGTATAYTVTSYQVFDTLAHLNGQMIAFTPHATNTNAVGVDITLSVDGLAAKSIRAQPSIALPNGSLVLGTPYVVTYSNADGVFYLRGMTNPYNIPLAGGMDFWGLTAPNTSFAFPTGQAISRTTYATLFSIMSTTYGSGDGSSTFNLPDKTGRVSAMAEIAGESRLTPTYFGGASNTLGAVGGVESATAPLPAHNHTLTDPGHTHTVTSPGEISPNSSPIGVVVGVNPWGASWSMTVGSSTTGVSIAAAGSGTGLHNNVQPTIICNYIIRII